MYYQTMRISVVSDTHNQHQGFEPLSGDVLIHCGDMFNLFSAANDDIERIDEWFGKQNFNLILCTGGNHDFALEERLKVTSSPFKNAVYLQDRSYVHDGVTFYGSPWTPNLQGHAFYQDSDQLQTRWSAIPDNIDVLITHTPPAGILDVSSAGLTLGCLHLAGQLQRISPRLHCFGHVHASSGTADVNGVRFINASSVNSRFELVRRPYEFVL